MFAMKSTVALAFLALSAQLVLATPPACLMKALNTEKNPADLETCCGRDAQKIQSNIQDMCGQYTDEAMQAFKDTCKSVGKDVKDASSSESSTSASHSPTKSSESASTTSAPYPIIHTSTYYDTECSCTKTSMISSSAPNAASTGFATGTIGSTGVATSAAATGSPIVPTSPVTPTGTSTGKGPNFTGAASRNALGSYAAAAVAGAGLLMAL